MAGVFVQAAVLQLLANRSAILGGDGRLYGTTNNPQHLGVIMAMTVPIACFYLVRPGERLGWRLLSAVFTGLGLIFVVWTKSRLGALDRGGAGPAVPRRLGQWLKVAAVGTVLVLIGLQIFESSTAGAERLIWTENTRAEGWARLIAVFQANPWLGSGREGDLAESSYLATLALFGVVGAIPLAVAVGLVLRDLLRLEWRRKRAGEDAMLFSLVISWLLTLGLVSVFEAVLLGTMTDTLFCTYVFLGLLAFLLDRRGGRYNRRLPTPPKGTGNSAKTACTRQALWRTTRDSAPELSDFGTRRGGGGRLVRLGHGIRPNVQPLSQGRVGQWRRVWLSRVPRVRRTAVGAVGR